jgi:cytidyltransferase-like protein
MMAATEDARQVIQPSSSSDNAMRTLAQDLRARAAGEKIIFISGNFNILHPGHLRLFRFATELGGRLIVGVNADGNEGVTVEQTLRLEDVRAIAAVHEAIALAEEPEAFIARLRPDYVVKGKEYQGLQNVEQAIVDDYGGTLLFSSGEVRFYSTELLSSDRGNRAKSTIVKPTDFPRRNGFGIDGLAATVEAFSRLKVVVIGDLIVDDYINCDPLGMSREDPTLVVTPVEKQTLCRRGWNCSSPCARAWRFGDVH